MIISKFTNLSDLNAYVAHLFHRDELLPLTAPQAFLFATNRDAFEIFFAGSQLELIDIDYLKQNLSEEDYAKYIVFLETFRPNFYYLYEGSKTKFINNLLNELVPSLSKKFYKAFDDNNNVIHTSTQYSIYSSTELTISSLADLSISLDESKALEIISDSLSSNAKDNEYLTKIIQQLESEIETLKSEINILNNKVSDSYVMTWN